VEYVELEGRAEVQYKTISLFELEVFRDVMWKAEETGVYIHLRAIPCQSLDEELV
jgi:hypothetical protein